MNTKTTLSKGSWIQLNERRAARAGILLLLSLLTLPAAVRAQFICTTNNGTLTITGYTGPGGDVAIPDTIDSLPVIAIADFAFYASTGLTSVTIPGSVTKIGSEPFLFCTNLTAIMVDPANTSYSDVAGVLCSNDRRTLVEYPCGKTGDYTIPAGVTSIGDYAFNRCINLTGLVIPNSVTSIGYMAFTSCTALTNATIGNGVTRITQCAFKMCTNLMSVTIPNSVTRIEGEAFVSCNLTNVTIPSSVTEIMPVAFTGPTLIGVYCQGNAPVDYSYPFGFGSHVTVYYLPGTTGWGPTFGGCPTVLWDPPAIQTSPPTQTAEANSPVNLRVWATGGSPLFCVWYRNDTNLVSCSTNCELALPSVQFSQSGAYTVVISNACGAVTSAPAMLNVVAAVERRPVPGVKVMGEAGSLLNVDSADSLSPAPHWTTLSSVSLTSTSQYYFDLALPHPPQRFYRAWQMGAPGVIPSLDLHLIPAITLTGSIGGSLRVDYINQFGLIDAWFTLDTVTLTNTSQLYFDVSAPMQPARLYRLVPLP